MGGVVAVAYPERDWMTFAIGFCALVAILPPIMFMLLKLYPREPMSNERMEDKTERGNQEANQKENLR
jgi:hypothetical protein